MFYQKAVIWEISIYWAPVGAKKHARSKILRKIVPCRFFLNGGCKKPEDKCNLHVRQESRRNPEEKEIDDVQIFGLGLGLGLGNIVKPESEVPKSKVPKSRSKGLGLTQ